MWSDEVNAFNQEPQKGGHPSGLTHFTNLNLSVCTYRTHLSRNPNTDQSSNSALASSPHSRKQDLHALLGNPQPPSQAHPASELPLLTCCESLLPKIPWKIASLPVSTDSPPPPIHTLFPLEQRTPKSLLNCFNFVIWQERERENERDREREREEWGKGGKERRERDYFVLFLCLKCFSSPGIAVTCPFQR